MKRLRTEEFVEIWRVPHGCGNHGAYCARASENRRQHAEGVPFIDTLGLPTVFLRGDDEDSALIDRGAQIISDWLARRAAKERVGGVKKIADAVSSLRQPSYGDDI